jgi:hypothetical protein
MTGILLFAITSAGALLALAVSRLPAHRALIYRASVGSVGLLYFSYLMIDAQSTGANPWVPMFWVFIALTLLVNAALKLSESEPPIAD